MLINFEIKSIFYRKWGIFENKTYILRAAVHDLVAVFHWPQQISFIFLLSMSILATLVILVPLFYISDPSNYSKILVRRCSRNFSLWTFIEKDQRPPRSGHTVWLIQWHQMTFKLRHKISKLFLRYQQLRWCTVHMLSIKYGCSFQCSILFRKQNKRFSTLSIRWKMLDWQYLRSKLIQKAPNIKKFKAKLEFLRFVSLRS